ncbi:MAG: GntR family transcriptional regulator [Solirubrobacteraceae bacterium]|nr:GntR family transcriptional regulator [Solirubrobacteraceae bacterium]
MLGVSRGTLRTALQRLEASGEIVRRQGSGTFVGQVAMPTAFVEGLERLEPYSMLARRRGVELGVRDVTIEERPMTAEVARRFGLAPGTVAPQISRGVLAVGQPAAVMADVVHPHVPLPREAALRRALERGEMILDVLLEQGVPIAFATTRVMPCMITPRERVGQLFGVRRTTAVLELDETIHVTSGEVVHHSRDLFAPGGMDLHVVRGLDAAGPAQVNPAPPEAGPRRRRRAAARPSADRSPPQRAT